MSQPTWADFVRWLCDKPDWKGRQEALEMLRAVHLVSTKNEARVAFAVGAGHGDDRFEDHVREWMAATGGAPVGPPDPLRERLEALAEELKAEGDNAESAAQRCNAQDRYDPVVAELEREADVIGDIESRLRAILAAHAEPAALPKPERVEVGQRWRYCYSPCRTVVHVHVQTLDILRVDFESGPWDDGHQMLTSPDWHYLGPADGETP